jgi:hypothetical protein
MKRRIALLLLCAVSVALALVVLIPKGHAERDAKNGRAANSAPARAVVSRSDRGGIRTEAAGLPNVLNSQSPLSAAFLTALGGVNTQFDEISLIANWDGREDFTADRGHKVDDLSFVITTPQQFVTRTGISEHTVANGFNQNVYYEGDSLGNFYIATDNAPGINSSSVPSVDTVQTVNIPELINTNTSGGVNLLNSVDFGDCSNPTVTITGIAVNPVADLGAFSPGLCGVAGEVVYVSVLDSAPCGPAQTRSRIIAFGFSDTGTGLATTGAVYTTRTQLAIGGLAVDDSGSLYFHLYDDVAHSGGAIFKMAELPRNSTCLTAGRINRVVTTTNFISYDLTTTSVTDTVNGMRLTNYSGTSPTFGNITALAAAPGNIIYAAVSRSLVASDDAATRATEGAFTNPAALGATPSMIISFADRTGDFDLCSTPDLTNPALTGVIPNGDGFADVAQNGLTLNPGVNNFRVFALGNGPDIRPVSPATSPIVTPSTLKLDMLIDYSIHAGLAIDETGSVYVVSGGAPASTSPDASPNRGEVLAFPDASPADRRADYIDLRGNASPNPPASGGNVGDGDSDRFDHIFWQAPLDSVTNTPTGIAGLSRGFLRYTNRLAPNAISPGVTLGQTGGQRVQGDDSTNGPIIFESLDPGHQVAGGDDQNTPFRGDDDDGAGNPAIPGALNGGFEFTFGGPVGTLGCVQNAFFLNSNGNITFGVGDTDNTPSVPELRVGPPRIAGAWSDLNPSSRAVSLGTFPVQAVGFADVNQFKVRYIDTPLFGNEACTGMRGNASNTFSISLNDDGTAIDENANQPLNPANPIGNNAVPFDLQEGPTDLRFTREPNTGTLVGESPRREGSGNFSFGYGRMDLLGTQGSPVITGYSIGGLDPLNPPGLCQTNLGTAATAAEADIFGVIQGQTASIEANLIGEGTEPTIYQLFDQGREGSFDIGTGLITLANVDFDLRDPGNDPAASKSVRQTDVDKGVAGFFGIGCAPPSSPNGQVLIPGPFVVAPNQNNALINALGPVTFNIIGQRFLPNEVTTVCPGGIPSGSIPTERPGKTVATASTLALDANGDGLPEATIALTSVTVVNRNLIRATAAPLTTAAGTAFPLIAQGGTGLLTTTTTFTAGDNNVFGPFTRSTALSLVMGSRAPVVVGVTAVQGTCGLPQDLLISGFGFVSNLVPPGSGITAVTAVQEDNPTTIIPATTFNVLNNNLITARFNLGAGNAGKRFRIFVTGNGGTSRNLFSLPGGAPAGVPLGNEQGNVIDFSCSSPTGATIGFGASSFSVSEGSSSATITATRANGAGALTVNYTTSDGTALQRSDYTLTSGHLNFADGETSKTFKVLINDDSYAETTESVNLTLSIPGNPDTVSAVLNIVDNDNPAPAINVIDDADNFVRQQYHDFLNRDPDAGGLAFWADQIRSCGSNQACINQKRVEVSAAFFGEPEFQTSGFYIYLVQKALTGTNPTYESFMHDRNSVQVGAGLDASKSAYAAEYLARPEFGSINGMTHTQYVDALNTNTGNSLTQSQRDGFIAALTSNSQTRAQVLRSIAENPVFQERQYNSSFVLMQYFGYLRRSPDAGGYAFWLDVLNNHVPGNFKSMVCAFLTSNEYQDRFGSMHSHSNSECGAIAP